ncbi:MAG TPA: dTDP-4-dehydrorhamnose reductase [Gemmatimonadaceae bacterium]|nr:dTDP-4-dehydrorhamnose reductase [Gemmatimonadaceae bacterium]
MRVVVTGANGMVGRELVKQAQARGFSTVALARADLDIRDRVAAIHAIGEAKPDLVINAAAYTAVDEAETHPDLATEVNRDGASNVAHAAAQARAVIVHISTDYVFDGASNVPYTPQSPPRPMSVYGATKLAGEDAVRRENGAHAIVRTSWLYNHDGRNFVRTMIRLARERETIQVVDDQRGSPTLAVDLAAALLDAGVGVSRNQSLAGTYHFTNSGVATWLEFAQAIFDEVGIKGTRLIPTTTAEYKTAARRPLYSVLDNASFTTAFATQPRHWREALHSIQAKLQ